MLLEIIYQIQKYHLLNKPFESYQKLNTYKSLKDLNMKSKACAMRYAVTRQNSPSKSSNNSMSKSPTNRAQGINFSYLK